MLSESLFYEEHYHLLNRLLVELATLQKQWEERADAAEHIDFLPDEWYSAARSMPVLLDQLHGHLQTASVLLLQLQQNVNISKKPPTDEE